jgi:hypothetical protein
MRSCTLWEPLLNSIATHARLWAGDAEATHPKKRSSSMTSVTGSPTGQDSPENARASCSANMALPSIVAVRVMASTVSRTVHSERRRVLVLCVPTTMGPSPPRRLSTESERTLQTNAPRSAGAGCLTHGPGPPRRTAVESSRGTTTARGRRPPGSAACLSAGSAAPRSGAATGRQPGERPHGRGCAR